MAIPSPTPQIIQNFQCYYTSPEGKELITKLTSLPQSLYTFHQNLLYHHHQLLLRLISNFYNIVLHKVHAIGHQVVHQRVPTLPKNTY